VHKVCKYSANDQQCGLFYWLGLQLGRSYWMNPHHVKGANALLPLTTAELVTNSQHMHLFSYGTFTYDVELRARSGGSFVEFELSFPQHSILVTDLLMRSGRANSNTFRNFQLEGSSDGGKSWEILFEKQLAAPWLMWHHVFTFSLLEDGLTKFCTNFRFWFDAPVVSLSGIEFFGVVNKKS